MTPDIPVELQLWDAEQCAAYFKETPEYFLRTRRHADKFPPRLPISGGHRPLWSAKAVIEWALA